MPEFHEAHPRNPKERPLTEVQKKRAEDHYTARIPHVMAKKHARGYQENYERLLGFAVVSYVLCARSFKPEDNPSGEKGWPPFAAHWTEKSMLAKETYYWKKREGHDTVSLDVKNKKEEGTVADIIPDHRRPDAELVEWHEEFDKVLSKLKGYEQIVVRLRVKDNMTVRQIAKRLKLKHDRVRLIMRRAVKKLTGKKT